MFLSGFAALGYEMVWTRMLSVGLGHEAASMLAVVAAFFCGTAAGAWTLDDVVGRGSAPGRWYAALELIIGLWSLLLIILIPLANNLAPKLMGPQPSALHQWSVAFSMPLLLLLPATFAMGGTLPAMECFVSRLRQNGWSVGGLYAANTFGAVAGTLAGALLMAPQIGFSKSLWVLAALNFICAAGALMKSARKGPAPPPVRSDHAQPRFSVRMAATLFLTGLLGIGYEILMVRAISQVLENTIYTFANLLSVYLLGNAAGAALYQNYAPRQGFEKLLSFFLQLLSILCLMSIIPLWFAQDILSLVQKLAGESILGALLGEAVLGFVSFFPPTVAMGATFAHLAQAARGFNGGLGKALSVNTLGATLAPLLFGVILTPWFGSKTALILTATSYLLLMPVQNWRTLALAPVPLALAVVLLTATHNLHFISAPPGGQIIAHEEGALATVSVIKDRQGDYHLKVNNKFQMGGTSSYFSDRRQGHIPLLLHPQPRRALFLGLGTGATFAACQDYPDLEAEGVELLPEIIPLLPYFKKSTGDYEKYQRLQIRVADARRFVNSAVSNYDVIVADLFHPARDGAGSLYTVEHFTAIRSRLNPDGIFCQWLPLYQLDLEMLRVIVRTFLHVFPEGSAFLAHYSLETPILGFVGGGGQRLYTADWMQQRVTQSELLQKLDKIRLANGYELFGCFAAGSEDLVTFAGEGPLNTDDRPVVTFRAPLFVYDKAQPPYGRLLELLKSFQPQPEEIIKQAGSHGEQEFQARLAAYWAARDRFMRAGVGVEKTDEVHEMLQMVREPLLEIVRLSPDFTAAYKPLLAMAYRLSSSDPRAGEELLMTLEKANPANDEARQLRLQLFSREPLAAAAHP